MSGADVFTMDPEEVHNAVAVLFEVEAEVEGQTVAVADATAEVAGNLKDANAALGAALDEAGEWWKVFRAGGFTGLVGNTGEYLATCAEEAVEIDDYNAGKFASFADHDLYPGRASENASARPDW